MLFNVISYISITTNRKAGIYRNNLTLYELQ